MGSVDSKPASDMVSLFDYGVQLTVQIWKGRSKRTNELFEWLTSTDRTAGARPKKLNVVRQNLVRYFESSLAY
jgi:hypothetical protein